MAQARSKWKVEHRETTLAISGSPTLSDLLEVATSLGAMSRAHQWWIGDLLVEAERRFGEEAAQLEVALAIAAQTALNYRWVAGRLEPSRRRETLTWSHHAEVARLEPADQDVALERAAAEGWGIRELRDFVALTWPTGDPSSPPAPATRNDLTDAELAAIARRLEALTQAFDDYVTAGSGASLENFVDADDVSWLIRTLRFVTRGGEKP